ncbi:AMT1-1 [Symbiodinium sp. CCMP2592]|nr:AMT1-1 [Symbiodinium sp. CCMP2592]
MATNAPLLGKAAHSKASIFYGADEYLEELKKKYEHDHEIAALKNALPGEGDPNAAGVAQSSDKMLSVQKNNENRSLKTNRLFPTPNKPDPMPQNLAFLFTKITPEQMIYMWNVLTAIFVSQVLMVIGYCVALACFPDYWWTCTLCFGLPFSYIAIQNIYIDHDVMHGATFPVYEWQRFLTHPFADFFSLPWEEFVLEHNRHHASTVDLLIQGEFGWDPEEFHYALQQWAGPWSSNWYKYLLTVPFIPVIHFFGLNDTGSLFALEWWMHFPDEGAGGKCNKEFWSKWIPRRIKHNAFVLSLWACVWLLGTYPLGRPLSEGWRFMFTVSFFARIGYSAAWMFITNFTHSLPWNEFLAQDPGRTWPVLHNVMAMVLGGKHRWNEMLFHDVHHAFPNAVGTLSQRGRFHGWEKVHDAAAEVLHRGLWKPNGDEETQMQKTQKKLLSYDDSLAEVSGEAQLKAGCNLDRRCQKKGKRDPKTPTLALKVTPLPCDLVHATPPDFRKHFRTGWQPDLGGVYFTNRTDMATRDPGIYSLCWCEKSTEGACESLEDYNLSAGGLVLAGPVRERKTIYAQFGEEFTVSVHMVLVTGESQLRLQSSCTEGAEVYAKAVSLERDRWGQVSDEKNFSFGELQENERMPAGTYKLCWCRVSYSYSPQLLCEDRDFITAVGDVVIKCPEHFWSVGSGSCQPCSWFWEVPNESRDGCKFDFLNTLAILAIFTYIFFGCAMFCYQLEVHISNKGFKFPIRGRKIAIEDVSSKPSSVEDEKHVIVTTVGEHKLSKRLGTIPIMFRRTDLFGMEKGADGEDLWFRLKYHSKRSFQLLSLSGEPVQRESAETSHGWIILSAHRSLLHSNTWFGVPVVIIGSLLIICGIPLLLYSSDRLRIPIDGGVVVVTWLITFILAFGGSQMIKMGMTTRNAISDKIDRFKSKVYRVNPTPHACKRGAERALNINQIVDLYEEFKSFIQDRNLYYVDSNIVRPLTRSCHLSLAEFVGPSTVDWFVSHYWGTNFSYTVRALKLHANSVGRDSLITQSRITITDEASKSIAATSSPVSRASDWKSPGSISYWICAFSAGLGNNQYRIDEELGTSHEDSSFYLALHSEWVVGTVMVLDEQALPLTRSWCLFELLQTMNLERQRPNFHGLRFATNTGVLNLGQSTTEVAMNIGKKLSSLSLENASATREQESESDGLKRVKDRTQIQELILKERKSWDGINGELRKHIKDALGVCRDHVDRSFQDIFHKLEHGSNNQVSMREASL